jgi:hypothetical protein
VAGWRHIVLRSGDNVKRVIERWADDYQLVEDQAAGQPDSQ